MSETPNESGESTDESRILHCFADHGVESETLSAYGQVTRVGIDPKQQPHSAVVTADASRPDYFPFESGTFDFALLHPPCTKWSRMTSIDGDPNDHENLLAEARTIGERYADHYVVENRPEAPLRDPVVLNGKMFGLPIHYERAFETSFPTDQPPRHQPLDTEVSTYFSADRTTDWWRSVKGVRGDYSKEHIVKNCLPAIYVHWLVRSWLKTVNERDAREAQDNNGSPPRQLAENQTEITEVVSR